MNAATPVTPPMPSVLQAGHPADHRPLLTRPRLNPPPLARRTGRIVAFEPDPSWDR
jgi:hypothetical protein